MFTIAVTAPDESIESAVNTAIQAELDKPEHSSETRRHLEICRPFLRQLILTRPVASQFTVELEGELAHDTGYGEITVHIHFDPLVPDVPDVPVLEDAVGRKEPRAAERFEEDDERPRRRAKTVSE